MRAPKVRPASLDPLHRSVFLQVPDVDRVVTAGGYDGLGIGGVRLVNVKAEREAARRRLQRLVVLEVASWQWAVWPVGAEDLGVGE